MTGKKLHRLTIDLEPDAHEALVDEAKRQKVPVAYIIRALISRHLGGPMMETKKALTVRLLREGASTDRIVTELTEEFGEASRSSVNWYRAKLKREGEDIPTDADARQAELRAAMEMGVYSKRSDQD